MTEATAGVDWVSWMRRWDRQQEGYLPDREARFAAMLDALSVLLPEEFVALDLCSGPGSISQRLLERFPKARSIAVDLDPVLLTMGQAVLGDVDGRLSWVTADLMRDDWPSLLGVEFLDAVLSTTALHWLPPENLVRVYRQLGRLVRPGGVFLDGDHLHFPPHMETFRLVAEALTERSQAAAFGPGSIEDWDAWWRAIAEEPGVDALMAERARRFAWFTDDWSEPIFELHEAALRDAGFREVGTIWQHLDNRVLMAIR